MKYRIILKIGYAEAWFDFDALEDAGEFAKTILVHQTNNEDCKRKSMVKMEIIDTTIENSEEED